MQQYPGGLVNILRASKKRIGSLTHAARSGTAAGWLANSLGSRVADKYSP